jgi:hypothetical protein
MKTRLKVGAVIGLAVGLVTIALRGCDKGQTGAITNGQLKPREGQAVVITPGTIQTIKRAFGAAGKQSTVVQRTTGVREARISIDSEGRVTAIVTKNRGFEFAPGLTGGIASRGAIGLDLGLAYWKSWDVITGLAYSPSEKHLSLYGGLAYKLPWKLTQNTSVFVSYTSDSKIYSGLRIAL